MNLKEAKEHLEKNGYKIQRLNECGFSSGGGSCSGWSSSSDDAGYSSSCRSSFSSRRNGCSGYSEEPIRPSFTRRTANTTQAPRADATIQDLLDKIPPGKKELVIQLLKALLAG